MVVAQVPIVPRAKVEDSRRRILQDEIEIVIGVILHRSNDVFQSAVSHDMSEKQFCLVQCILWLLKPNNTLGNSLEILASVNTQKRPYMNT